MKRIHFLLPLLFLSQLVFSQSSPLYTPEDSLKLEEIHSRIAGTESMGERVLVAGLQMLGTPYVAHTLEHSTEALVINLRGVDCTTFVEYCLALARCREPVAQAGHAFPAFANELLQIRYRRGVLDGYASRLHYFSDWIFDNGNLGIVEDMGKQLGGVPLEKHIEFMSTHAGLYPQLKEDSLMCLQIRKQEAEIRERTCYYIPSSELPARINQFRSGDIVAIVTRIAGLDVSHTGILYRKEGEVRLLHASSSAGSVVLSQESIVSYLAKHSLAMGLLVVRPLDPVE